ncbi:MAG TPA: hypothetical protein VNC61_14750 [Acidimicrobiales bacterium]|nr:hypothetical protein [Acidimicrobiales bacterium]
MNGLITTPGPRRTGGNGHRVRVVTPYRSVARKTTGVGTKKVINDKRVRAWVVRVIMMATTGFALLDLLLLASGGHH